MRKGVIQRITSRLLWFTAVAQVVPMLVAMLYTEWLGALAFGIAGALATILAFGFANLPAARESPSDSLRRREGFVAVVLGWMILVTFTAVAYHVTGAFVGFAEAFFESMSGFTTTGASVVSDIEGLPKCILFMRSFSHWIGGMGIIVLSVAILPELAVGGLQMFSAESSGLEAEKLAPRIANTARRLWVLYFAITAAQMLLLVAGGMGVFDSVNHSMATIATGGFSTKNTSVAGFDSLYIEMVILVFMFVSGISFTLQYRAIIGGEPKRLLQSPELRLYCFLTLGVFVLATISVYSAHHYDSLAETARYTSFQTVSIVTTTGFGTADFSAWPDFTQLIMVGLMIVGGCAGSTAGGSKVIRLYVVIKHASIQLRRLVRPRLVEPLAIGDREINRETTEAVLGFYLLYMVALMIGAMALTALGMDLVSGSTAAVSALNSIGPGLGTVGAAENFGHVPDLGLYLLSFGMLLGRLEIYTVLVLFTVHFWRRG